MQIQTVFKAGNSDVIAIPKHLSEETGIKSGIKIVVDKVEGGIFVRKAEKQKPKKNAVNKEFKKWLGEVLKEDAEILNELAER